jgi:hypothetical protein
MSPHSVMTVGGCLILGLAGCSSHTTTPVSPRAPLAYTPQTIDAFVKSEPIVKPQPVRVLLTVGGIGQSVGGGDLTFFCLQFGDEHYDLAGNWYDVVYGVRYRQKIGWVVFADPEPGMDLSGMTMYKPASDDRLLYSRNTWDAIQNLSWPDLWLYWGGLMPMLAGGADVPESTLAAVAGELRAHDGHVVAWLLLGNPTVVHSREVLTVLATLPTFPWGDPYQAVRQRAQELLDALPASSL